MHCGEGRYTQFELMLLFCIFARGRAEMLRYQTSHAAFATYKERNAAHSCLLTQS